MKLGLAQAGSTATNADSCTDISPF